MYDRTFFLELPLNLAAASLFALGVRNMIYVYDTSKLYTSLFRS